MIISFGGKEYVSGALYAAEDILAAYKQGLRNGKWEAEQGNKDDLYYESGYRAATEKFKKQIITSEEDCEKQYVRGKTDGYNEGYQHGFTLAKEKISELDGEERKLIESYGYNNGYEEATAEFELGNDFTNKLEDKYFQKGYSEGYGDAIKEMSNSKSLGEDCGNISILDFGAIGEGYTREPYPVTEGIDIIKFIKDNFDNIKSFTQVGAIASIEMFDKNNSGRNEHLEKDLELVEKYPHYYKDIRHLNIIDIYRFFDLFEVTDPCLQHSMKKLAVGGKRGAKDYEKDIKEAMDTLKRWEYMQEENKRRLDD